VRECPDCRRTITVDRHEIREKNLEKAKFLSGRLEQAVSENDFVHAKSLIKELRTLNQLLHIEGINIFIRQMKKKIAMQ
jgi:hypothetical protein